MARFLLLLQVLDCRILDHWLTIFGVFTRATDHIDNVVDLVAHVWHEFAISETGPDRLKPRLEYGLNFPQIHPVHI